jgi:glycosyltransferase involved in cell wall biosynthesis
MSERRLRVLCISELFPNPVLPALGIFVERQTFHLQPYCDNIVVAPVRVFPHLQLWKHLRRPTQFGKEWRRWRSDLARIPARGDINGLPVYYPRYTSLPKQIFHGLWGFFAYVFVRKQLIALHRKQPFDLIHAHYASPCGVIALLAQRWMKVPVVVSIHGADVTYTAKQQPIGAAVIAWVFRHVDVIIANSAWTADQVVRYGGDPRSVQIVRYGGRPDPAAVARLTGGDNASQIEDHAQNRAARLLSIGNLFPSKGQAYVLHAMRRLLDLGYALEYVIVGEGFERKNLERTVRELGLEGCVRFEGYKPHSAVWDYFAACDIFVLPSWIEGFGMVYIEALAMGKPVIGCEGTGGPEDLKTLGDCIELVKPRDLESLVDALKRLLDDPERRQRMGEIGGKIVSEYFTWERNAADTLAIYEQLRARKGVPVVC